MCCLWSVVLTPWVGSGLQVWSQKTLWPLRTERCRLEAVWAPVGIQESKKQMNCSVSFSLNHPQLSQAMFYRPSNSPWWTVSIAVVSKISFGKGTDLLAASDSRVGGHLPRLFHGKKRGCMLIGTITFTMHRNQTESIVTSTMFLCSATSHLLRAINTF